MRTNEHKDLICAYLQQILYRKFSIYFLKQYNLDILNKALQITGRRGPSRAAEGTIGSAFSDFIRAGTGQFTLTGRLFTAFRRIGKSARERVIANALFLMQ